MLGLVLIIIAIFVGVSSDMFKRVPNQKTVLGKILAVNRLYAITPDNTAAQTVVEYKVEGVPYKTTVVNKQYHKVGKRMALSYNTKDPKHLVIRPSVYTYVLVVLFLFGGSAMFLSSIFGGL